MRNGDYMDELKFSLMHKDDPVCAVTMDADSGAMLRVSKPIHPELLPPGGNMDASKLRKWWQLRAVPMDQGKIMRIIEQAGFSTTQKYLVRNWGLSLTDHYWIKPLDVELSWDDVNLFTNDFRDPVGDMQFADVIGKSLELPQNAFSPSSSLQGNLRKKWVITNGKRCLIKANHGSNSQESLNEVAATLLHFKQEKQPYVSYAPIHGDTNDSIHCICESFTSDSIELLTAYDMIESVKCLSSVSSYEHFIRVCESHGLSEEGSRPFLEYQIVTDFVLTNTDRHLRNIGVLRNTDTLQLIGMAPIFDTGNSMFWDNPRLPLHQDLTDIEVNSFRSKESQLLKYVQSQNRVDISKLPSEDELRAIYEKDLLFTQFNSIFLGYQKKIDLLARQNLI